MWFRGCSYDADSRIMPARGLSVGEVELSPPSVLCTCFKRRSREEVLTSWRAKGESIARISGVEAPSGPSRGARACRRRGLLRLIPAEQLLRRPGQSTQHRGARLVRSHRERLPQRVYFRVRALRFQEPATFLVSRFRAVWLIPAKQLPLR
eukprot:CAMPEP_0180167414 /NCGR_PEP_ID=MMETSP0986-20121125/32113_1 /TAXON_ID=697907 /ORGANISM="non described non described, Strain CCMP2293" /LENGTH=150 /DNA_ID=CAMNT_0022118701 /DNA_START=203 /DNA_END=652 /DNA_ORIENTATION=+